MACFVANTVPSVGDVSCVATQGELTMQFMVEGVLKQAHTDETRALIPLEIAHGKALDTQGVRAMLYLAADFSKAWQIYNLDSQEAVRAVLASLPLYPFVTYTITPLAEPLP
jgi:muconolactone delta-isomerase